MKQTIESKYTLELNQQEFATILAAVFSTTEVNLKKYYSHGGADGLSSKDFDIIIKGLANLHRELYNLAEKFQHTYQKATLIDIIKTVRLNGINIKGEIK